MKSVSDDKKEEIQNFHKFLITSFEKDTKYDHYEENEWGKDKFKLHCCSSRAYCWQINADFQAALADTRFGSMGIKTEPFSNLARVLCRRLKVLKQLRCFQQMQI